jgi:hypothetical protein
VPLTHLPTPPLLFDASLNLTNKLRKKKRLRKKILSFSSSSNGKKVTTSGAMANNSITSSISSLSLKNQKASREEVSPSPEPPHADDNDSNVLSVLSKGTQRLFGTNNSSDSKKLAESLNEDSQFYKLTEGDDNNFSNRVSSRGSFKEAAHLSHKNQNRLSGNFTFQESKLNFKSNFLSVLSIKNRIILVKKFQSFRRKIYENHHKTLCRSLIPNDTAFYRYNYFYKLNFVLIMFQLSSKCYI